MSAANAEMLLYAITAVAVLVWIEGLRHLANAARKSGKRNEFSAKLEEAVPANVIYGSAEVQGGAEALSGKAAALLAASSMMILERSGEKIVFQTPDVYLPDKAMAKKMEPGIRFSTDPLAKQSRAGYWLAMQGQLQFTRMSAERTRVDYAITAPRMRHLLTIGFAIQALGLIAIIAGFLLIYFLVVPSQDSAVRWQTVQMIQVVHFLWPPFLCASLYRRPEKMIRAQFELFVHNLPFVGAM